MWHCFEFCLRMRLSCDLWHTTEGQEEWMDNCSNLCLGLCQKIAQVFHALGYSEKDVHMSRWQLHGYKTNLSHRHSDMHTHTHTCVCIHTGTHTDTVCSRLTQTWCTCTQEANTITTGTYWQWTTVKSIWSNVFKPVHLRSVQQCWT